MFKSIVFCRNIFIFDDKKVGYLKLTKLDNGMGNSMYPKIKLYNVFKCILMLELHSNSLSTNNNLSLVKLVNLDKMFQ